MGGDREWQARKEWGRRAINGLSSHVKDVSFYIFGNRNLLRDFKQVETWYLICV